MPTLSVSTGLDLHVVISTHIMYEIKLLNPCFYCISLEQTLNPEHTRYHCIHVFKCRTWKFNGMGRTSKQTLQVCAWPPPPPLKKRL